MNIVDAVIIILFIVGILGGLSRGFIKQTVILIGLFLILIISFYLKNPVATFLYKYLPFFNFHGVFKGVSILNILLYEIIAFLLVFSITYLILRILIKITGIIESILKATVILGFISKILGGVVGFLESYILVFITLFILSQPFLRVTGIEESWLATNILDHTPIMSESIKETRYVVKEVYDLSKVYKNDSKKFNNEAIKLFVKYEIISEENLDYLINKGKIEYED